MVQNLPSSSNLPQGRHLSSLSWKGLGVGVGIGTLLHWKMGGENFGTSLLRSGLETVAFAAAPAVATAYFLGPMAARGIVGGGYRMNRNMAVKYNEARRPGTNFSYQDSQAALTMRQSAVQAIQGSKLNARNALGGEAALMHRGHMGMR